LRRALVRLVGNLFELEDLGAQDLKGITGPVRAWAALRGSSAEGRFEAMHPTGLTERKFMGDGVLVYFGYPHAHEDDAERAVRAGLKLVAAVADLKIHAPLRTRVGIATGLVVVGDLIGSGASQEQAIVGEMTSRRSSGSMRDERAVDPENITVT
jgi:class 3 adenylate cyclase